MLAKHKWNVFLHMVVKHGQSTNTTENSRNELSMLKYQQIKIVAYIKEGSQENNGSRRKYNGKSKE